MKSSKISDARLAKLVKSSVEIQEATPKEAQSITYLARPFVQATLPHRNPGPLTAWGRENGNLSLTVQAAEIMKNGKITSLGLPYGSIPRLLLFWATEEVMRTNNPRLELGNSLAEFMRELGLDPQRGGKRSDAARLKEQMIRLFSARISFSMSSDNPSEPFMYAPLTTADKMFLAWDTTIPVQGNLFESYIHLSEPFFQELKRSPVPLDMRILNELRQSPLALDLYTFLTWRVSFLKKQTTITFEQLSGQIGSEYTRLRDFKSKVSGYIKMIQLLYPDLSVELRPNGVALFPSLPSVPKK